MKTLRFAIAVFLASVPSRSLAQEEDPPRYSLRFGLSQGDRLRYDLTTRRTIRWAGVADIEEKVEEIESWLLEVVEGGGGGPALLRITQTRNRIERGTNQFGTSPLSFDSEGKTEEDLDDLVRRDPRLSTAAALVGRSYDARIDPTGEVLALEGLPEYMGKMAEIAREELGKEAFERIAVQLMTEGEGRMKEALRIAFAYLPPEKVAVGESWQGRWSRNLPPFGRVAEEPAFVLEEMSPQGEARISFRSQATYQVLRPLGQPLPEGFTISGRDTIGSGTIRFDSRAGKLVRLEAVVGLTLSTRFPDEVAPEEDAPIPDQVIEDTRLLELVGVLPRDQAGGD